MALYQGDHLPPGGVVAFQPPEHGPGQLGADLGVTVKMVHSGLVGGFTGGFANVVEQHGQTKDLIGGGGLQGADGVFPAAPAVPGVVLLQLYQRGQLRPELAQNVWILPQDCPCVGGGQEFAQFHTDALSGHMVQHGAAAAEGLGGLRLDGVAQNGGEAQGAHKAKAVLLEAADRVAHAADAPGLNVGGAAEGVLQSSIQGHGDSIHGKIPAGQVLPQAGDKPDPVRAATIGICAVGAVGCDLVGPVRGEDGYGSVFEAGFNDLPPGEVCLCFLREG